MQIVFFAKDRDLLDLIAPLSEEKIALWYGEDLSSFTLEEEGIIFFDYDDPEFDLQRFSKLLSQLLLSKSQFMVNLLSARLGVKEFKKLQKENKFIDGFIRAPIKLKDIETFVEDYKLVEKEMREGVEGAKKKDIEDPVNGKIQRKFDLVFDGQGADRQSLQSENTSTVFNNGSEHNIEDDFILDGDTSMGESAKKQPGEVTAPNIDLDFNDDEGEIEFSNSPEETPPKAPTKSENTTQLSVVPDDEGLEFNLDFDNGSPEIPSIPEASATDTKSDSHFELDMSADEEHVIENGPVASTQQAVNVQEEDGLQLDNLFDAELEMAASNVHNDISDGTQKTILFEKSKLSDIALETGSTKTSSGLMTPEEEKANIESTIKDILRPKNLDSTQEIDLFSLEQEEEFNDSAPLKSNTMSQDSATGEFDLSAVEFADVEDVDPLINEVSEPVSAVTAKKEMPVTGMVESRTHASFVSDEDSTRFQATIRQLREEREELLSQIKNLKGETRELEQDNLTLKAALDESKIEVSILRKRHMVEIEDMKYRLSVNEEKKALAEEKARIAESKREKLEQRVRIDFNQVKQREKELETKLEMLSIDVDSQVQSRDHKILELRRKIDALEFNMENVSIKEQKSQDDKRKLEDKLNKIMKTLRHSIKNLEDDIDQATDESQDDKDKNDHRSKA